MTDTEAMILNNQSLILAALANLTDNKEVKKLLVDGSSDTRSYVNEKYGNEQ